METKIQKMTITPEMAEQFLKRNLNNRPLNKDRVSFYSNQMKIGNWMFNGDSIKFDDSGYLIDGQHRLQAVIESGIPMTCIVVKGLGEGSFATIDCGRARNAADVCAIYGCPNATTVASIIRRYAALGNTKISLKQSGLLRGKAYSNVDILNEYISNTGKYTELAAFAKQIGKSSKHTRFPYSCVAAIAEYLIYDLHYPKDRVYSFFTQLFSLDSSDNIMIDTLRKKLINDKTATTQMSMTYMQSLIAIAWNAYRKGRILGKFHYDADKQGIVEFE